VRKRARIFTSLSLILLLLCLELWRETSRLRISLVPDCIVSATHHAAPATPPLPAMCLPLLWHPGSWCPCLHRQSCCRGRTRVSRRGVPALPKGGATFTTSLHICSELRLFTRVRVARSQGFSIAWSLLFLCSYSQPMQVEKLSRIM
jgi:hypothetical protein